MKRNLPLLIISAISAAVIIVYVVGVKSQTGPALITEQRQSLKQQSTSSAPQSLTAPTGQQPQPAPQPQLRVSSKATIIRDDLARFWIVWQGRKYLLSPAGIPQEKANLLATIDATKKTLSVINCNQAPDDKVVILAYNLYLVKGETKYHLSYQQVTGNYAGSWPTAQGCLLPQAQ